MLKAKIDNLVYLSNKLFRSGSYCSQVNVGYCTHCGENNNSYDCFNCVQVQYDDNYYPPQYNPQPNTYNLGWIDHLNFGWYDQWKPQQPTWEESMFQSYPSTIKSKPIWEMASEQLASDIPEKFERMKERFDRMEDEPSQ